jgi:methylated-DNA-[protein]-cysteine S-methyltransferase
VIEALESVPFGETISYGELAAEAGRPGAARAVGTAVDTNPLPIVVPATG